MSKKKTLVMLASSLILSAPAAIARDAKEPLPPGSEVSGDNAKAILAGNLLADGIRRYGANEYADALKRFNTVIDLDAKRLGAYYYRGLTQKKLGKTAAAKKDFKAATALTPTTAEEYDLRGKAFEEMGLKTEARADFKRAKAMTKNKAG